MPEIDQTTFTLDLKDLFEKAITLSISNNDLALAKIECADYLSNKEKDTSKLSPLAIYYILSKFSSKEQISFIKENLQYIKKNHKNIFLYHTLSPKSLLYFLSYEVVKEIYSLDIEIFEHMLTGDFEQLITGFSIDEIYKFYTDYFLKINQINNSTFISSLHTVNRYIQSPYKTMNYEDFLNNQMAIKKSHMQFAHFIIETYSDKINSFTPNEFFGHFITFILKADKDIYDQLIVNNKEKILLAIAEMNITEMFDFLSNLSSHQQKIILSYFFKDIIQKHSRLIFALEPSILIELYSQNKEQFPPISLIDWVKISTNSENLDEDIKKIIEGFNLDSIKELFKQLSHTTTYFRKNWNVLKYLEMKFRNNIITDSKIENITFKTSIFSNTYLKNLKEMHSLLVDGKITRKSSVYTSHLKLFIHYLSKHKIVNGINKNDYIEIEKLFYRIIMGESLTVLNNVNSIEEITIINRLHKKEFDASNFSIEQLAKYNVKEHRMLCNKYIPSISNNYEYKTLILKLMLLLGYDKANYVLSIDNNLTTLEHLVGNVDVKSIKLDNNGDPIVNKKIINLLFKNNSQSIAITMLKDNTSPLYKYFPRIFNEWEIIQMYNKGNSLSSIIHFLQSDEISLPIKYYRLEGQFKFIGCQKNIVEETLNLHDEALMRIESTIPRITGVMDDYTYEVLRLDDMEAISIGNKTDCCFTVLGNSYSSLKHALTSKNGRVLVIKKDDKIVAHSWLWRNGNLLCLDNIEVDKSIKKVTFFNIYLEFAKQIINESLKYEGEINCIKNVTIGYTDFDKPIEGIEEYLCFIHKDCFQKNKSLWDKLGANKIIIDSLPQPIENGLYSDSKNVQYLICGDGNFNSFDSTYLYKDKRKAILSYNKDDNLDEASLEKIETIINCLHYIKCEKASNIDDFTHINLNSLSQVYCNDDWFIAIDEEGIVEKYINSNDPRAYEEMNEILEKINNIHLSEGKKNIYTTTKVC